MSTLGKAVLNYFLNPPPTGPLKTTEKNGCFQGGILIGFVFILQTS
jgi:hypothetical protein